MRFTVVAIVAVTWMGTDHGHGGECQRKLGRIVTPEWITRAIHEDAASPARRQLRNTLQHSGFTAAALRSEILKAHSKRYTLELPQGVPVSQGGADTCWIHCGHNMVRSLMLLAGLSSQTFQLSAPYLYFFALLEQSNRYLEEAAEAALNGQLDRSSAKRIRRLFYSGGEIEHFWFLANKYGLVPLSAFPESESSQDIEILKWELHQWLSKSAAVFFDEVAIQHRAGRIQKIRALKEQSMRGVWNLLVSHLGTPPGEIRLSNEDGLKLESDLVMTPIEFSRKLLHFDPDGFVIVSSHPGYEFNRLYEVKDSEIGVSSDGARFSLKRLNLPLGRLEALTVKSISHHIPVVFSAHMGPLTQMDISILHPHLFDASPVYGVDPISPADATEASINAFRRLGLLLRSRLPNHVMVITGYDRPVKKGPVRKFRVENSWSDQDSELAMYREWFQYYGYDIVVPKSLLSAREQTILSRPPIRLTQNFY